MSVPVWPVELPQPARDTYQAQLAEARVSKQNGGVPGYRRRFSSVATFVSLSIDVPRSKKAVFDNFYADATKHGSLPFWMPDPVTDGWPLLTSGGTAALTATAQPILLSGRYLVLFGDETPVQTLKALRFNIAFTVVVLP